MFCWEIDAVTLNKNDNNSCLDGAAGGCTVEECCSASFRTPWVYNQLVTVGMLVCIQKSPYQMQNRYECL